MNVHKFLVASIALTSFACSVEPAAESLSSEVKTKEILGWSEKECEKDKGGTLAGIAKDSEAAVKDAIKAIASQKPTKWMEREAKGIKVRKEGSCFVVTNGSKERLIISVNQSGVSARAGCSSMADMRTFGSCNDFDAVVYEVPKKLCKGDHIYVAGQKQSGKWTYDEYNSSISAHDSKLLISECGKVSNAFNDSDD
jgi:hypothetical protein